MRRLWMGATWLVMLAACRTEGTNDRALGTERSHGDTFAPEPSGAEKSPGKRAEAAAALVARILVMAQTMAEGEIETAKLAEERAAGADVKAYAEKLASQQKQDLEAMTRLTQNKRIDRSAGADDPLIKAKRAVHREKMERLSRLSGQAFSEEYMQGEPSEHALLSALAREGEELSKDNELGAFFRMVGGHAEEHRTRALAVVSLLCSGAAGAEPARGARSPSGPEHRSREADPTAKAQRAPRRQNADQGQRARTAPRDASPSLVR